MVLQLDADDDDDNDDDDNGDNGRPHQVLLGLLWIGAGAVALVRLLQEQVDVTEILISWLILWFTFPLDLVNL